MTHFEQFIDMLEWAEIKYTTTTRYDSVYVVFTKADAEACFTFDGDGNLNYVDTESLVED
jgi:hypothetical protein